MTLLLLETSTQIQIERDKFWDYFDFGTSSNDNITEDIVEVVEGVQAPEQGLELTIYSVLLVIGAVGNVSVLVSLLRSRRRKSRVNLLMTHLAVADMIVVFVVIPLEIGWKSTNAWLAGNLACKVFSVLRAFGLYLSSNILVCISIDRFFAVLYPLRLHVARRRSKKMLHLSWIIAFMCSLPQSKVFSVKSHPRVPEFHQCVTFGAFESPQQELIYNILCLMAMYFIPLLVITGCYARIFWEISKNSKEIYDKYSEADCSRVQLRRSDERPLARARRRTLRMTVTIVTVFACCWLPYATMTLWYMLDRESARHVSAKVQSLFFVMAVSNSCMDPLVYGSYALDLKTFIRKALVKIYHLHENSPENPSTLKTKGSNALPLIENVKKPSRIIVFQDTSFSKPAGVCSDPVQIYHECSSASPTLKPSRSHEVFSLQSLGSKSLSKRSVHYEYD